MELGWLQIAGAAAAGWLSRELFKPEGKPEIVGAPCTCVCRCAAETDYRSISASLGMIFLAGLCLSAVVFWPRHHPESASPRKGKGVYRQSSRTLQLTL